ncbi:L-Ala-D/L-Glu epimerase [bacterium BMS3Abin05]|nr:L-Ala-D/L-Glu epimerase [bacterium BMS3Abin05]GBE27315.1 L-Ala-D/L-Glu epimerase [bacterium BMS3Bbin03]HDL78588.1 dipeptide epimerase [Bacteroidota bacterium]HDZ12264.1 dipeptide epimerase [Bacteroidota bacterium]
MKLRYEEVSLHLKHTFRLHGGSKDRVKVLIAYLEHEGLIGLGEADPSKYYGETPESVKKVWDKIDFSNHQDPFLYETIYNDLKTQFPDDHAALAGIDIAMLDWMAKYRHLPLYQFLGLHKEAIPVTSFTIGHAPKQELIKKVKEAEPFHILKIKLGTDFDQDIIESVRQLTDKPIRVDANEGWTREEALEKIQWLSDKNVQFVEQPLKKEDIEGNAWLKERVSLPLFADESARTVEDVFKIKDAFDGVVIKLVKAGGIQNAVEMTRLAHKYKLKTLLSCFLETSIAISAAAHISPLFDYADLDGHLLVSDDPFEGLTLENGKVMVSDKPGLGIERRNDR